MARELGATLADRGIRLVYGGADVGLMGELADAMLERGGEVTGVITEALTAKGIAHQALTELRIVASMHERKQLLVDLSDAFIALPGGIGTVEEFVEVLTWAQLGLHKKPCGILDVAGFFGPFLNFLDLAVEERFLTAVHRSMVLKANDPDDLLDRFEEYVAPTADKWIDRP